MNKKLYYTVNLEIDEHSSECSPSLTGMKTIQVYDMIGNEPKMFCTIDASIEDSSEAEIQVYLDNNGYDDEYEFIEL